MNIPGISYFERKPMGVKLSVLFASVILIPMTVLAVISYHLIGSLLETVAENEVRTGMKAAWGEYYTRGEQMRYGMLQVSTMDEVKSAVAAREADDLTRLMAKWSQMRPYVDIWAVVDTEGRVVARLNSSSRGDLLELNGLVRSSMVLGEPLVSTEVLSAEQIRLEGQELKELMSPSPGSNAEEEQPLVEAMALMVVTPVTDAFGDITGAIITGDVLNSDIFIPDSVAGTIDGLFTTISLKGYRITTNLIDPSGRNLRMTRVDPGIYTALETRGQVVREWEVSGMSYLSAFEPIRDSKGKVIGTLDVAISKQSIWGVQKENLSIIALVTVLGLGVSLLAAAVSTFRITRPLKDLTGKLALFAEKGTKVRAAQYGNGEARDELNTLARTFNYMMDEVERRDREKERYLEEIASKNRELTRLNEDMKVTNEELEVAYEETQSQTEELHAINEELKLLNEDLDRKNNELKRANQIISAEERELKRTRNKLRLIYDGIREFILLVDRDLSILEANRYLMEKLGVGEEDVAGRSVYEVLGMEPPKEGCPVAEAIDSGKTVERELSAPDEKILLWHVFPLVDRGEEDGDAVVYIKDVTENRMLTHKLIQSDKLSSLGELVSGVAHELNNPLTGIMCFSELLMEDELGPGADAKLKKINDASHRCKKIIENLLTFSRWRKPEKCYGDVNKLVRESVELKAYQLKMNDIEVVTDLDEKLPFTMLDENQVEQVFLNLINNAHDAITEKGGGGKIFVSTRHSGGEIIVTFTDDGKGMPEEMASRIFDPFFTTKDVGKGTGLGLSISYGIINEHGGDIRVSSSPGKGTTFTLILPVAQNRRAEDGVPPGGQRDRSHLKAIASGKRAMALDDEPIVLDLLKDALKEMGFAVDAASRADEAISRIKENEYDIIVSDIKMPGMDGRDLYRTLTELRPEAAKRLVFISGDSVNEKTKEFISEVGSPHLQKPFTVDQLMDLVARVIS